MPEPSAAVPAAAPPSGSPAAGVATPRPPSVTSRAAGSPNSSGRPPSAVPAVPQPRATLTGARLVRAVTARSLDAAGAPVDETGIFSTTSDRTIVLAIELAAASRATTVTYRRFYEGAFVDAKTTHPVRDGDGIVSFTWRKVAGATFPSGAYLVHVFVDGRDLRTVAFTVR